MGNKLPVSGLASRLKLHVSHNVEALAWTRAFRRGDMELYRSGAGGVVAGWYAPLSFALVTEWCLAQTAVLCIWNCVKAMYSVDIDNLSRFSLGEWSGGIGRVPG